MRNTLIYKCYFSLKNIHSSARIFTPLSLSLSLSHTHRRGKKGKFVELMTNWEFSFVFITERNIISNILTHIYCKKKKFMEIFVAMTDDFPKTALLSIDLRSFHLLYAIYFFSETWKLLV